ncbi:adenosylcobinamide-GDP ribazoletransferase, partial [Vibrio sp. 1287]|nr:adenosylcobinamide-GDP ribazoletransferase [Vibrio sp. 1287]
GGFTGDCLGAAQQLSELLVYLTLIAFYQNI